MLQEQSLREMEAFVGSLVFEHPYNNLLLLICDDFDHSDFFDIFHTDFCIAL